MHIPYENGGGISVQKSDKQVQLESQGCICRGQERLDNHELDPSKPCYCVRPERPEDPIDEVVDITEAMWEDRDLYISGDKGER